MAVYKKEGKWRGKREGGIELLKYLRHYVRNLLKVNLAQSHLPGLSELAILREMNIYSTQKRKFQFYSV